MFGIFHHILASFTSSRRIQKAHIAPIPLDNRQSAQIGTHPALYLASQTKAQIKG
jgi:hypothetical protein